MKTETDVSFKHSKRSLFIWFAVTYFIFSPLLKYLRNLEPITDLLKRYFTFDFDIFSASISSTTSFFLYLLLAYLAFYYFYPKKKALLLLGLIASLFLPIALRFFIDQHLFLWLFGETNYLPGTSYTFYFSDNTYFAVYYIPSGILYYFFQRNKALQEARIEAEKQKALAEITHLRSQVNPHFLFNSLNNIYSLAYDKSDKILGAIEGLSELLRYALYEKSEFVPLKVEWEKVQQLIKIEQMRLITPVDFQQSIDEKSLDTQIPPVILLPLIENVFKHGVVQSTEDPPQIEIHSSDNTLHINIKNKVSNKAQKDQAHGIGLDNIRKRLTHYYGNKATFDVFEKDDTFSVQIALPVA